MCAVALADLHVETQLALVHDLPEPGGDGAVGALAGRGHVLDADLEAHGGASVTQMLEGQHGRAALHHPDQSRCGENLHREGAAHVGEEQPLRHELVGALEPGLQRHDAAPGGGAGNGSISGGLGTGRPVASV